MSELHTEILIDAPAARVWSILMDFERYPEWNPFVSRIDGTPQEGERLKVRLTPPGGMAMSMSPRVVAVEPQRHFRWLGHLGIKGIFDGEHRFEIEPLGDDRVRFVHSERFGGLLAAPILMMARKSTLRGFEAMNQALKQRAEAGTA
jgi:hypothetical protein